MRDVTGASCVEFETELFYDSHPFYIDTAKTICNGDAKIPRCPLRDECREWGLTHLEWGVWGGLSEKDRETLTGKRPYVGKTPILLSLPIRKASRQQPVTKESRVA
jgi:Transcription factor WhiB